MYSRTHFRGNAVHVGKNIWDFGTFDDQLASLKIEGMALRVVKFERCLHKNQHIQRKLLNFEFWINGEQSKIGHQLKN